MLSVIVPTLGRDTLPRLLNSIDHPVDLVVIAHGHQPETKDLVKDCGGRYFEYDPGVIRSGGGLLRDWATDEGLALGTHLVANDDSDEFLPGALEYVESVVSDVPMFFSILQGTSTFLPPEEPLEGYCDGHQFVVPNTSNVGRWTEHPHCDWCFIKSTLELYGGAFMRDETPIARTHNRPSY